MANIQRDLASYIDDFTEKKIISKLNDRRIVPLSLLLDVDDKIRIFVLQSILRRFGIFKLDKKVRRNFKADYGSKKDEAA